ncbi:hypothetical protein ACFE04_006786 [Oxalis oulophora]
MGRMSRSTLAKKLKPVKKAWKSFTNKFQSKLEKFSGSPKAIKETTHRLLVYVNFHFMLLFKRTSLTIKPYNYNRGSEYQQSYYLYQNQNQNQIHDNTIRAVYIDQLYSEAGRIPQMQKKQVYASRGETSRGKQVMMAEDKPTAPLERRGSYGENSVEEVWNSIVARSPALRCVDDRADEFIYKFRKDMKLQKEKSDDAYQQMLARSS